MSSDNGIYILQTKDQYRVIHAQAIDGLYWSFVNKNSYSSEPISTRIIQYFGDSKYTRDHEIAMNIANKMANRILVLEYGINTIEVNKTWREIEEEAKEYAKLEIEEINRNNDGRWNYELESLKKIAS